MLSKCASFRLLLLLCAIVAPAVASPNYRHFCPHCEEEVWEEVPCEQISTRSTTTTTTTASPPRTTYTPTTQRPSTTPRPYTKPPTPAPEVYTTTTAASVSSTTPSTYQNCYCECKGGCKEFCRKVTVSGASEKQITQITKTSHRVPNGQLNSEHVHQHIFVPTPHVPYTPAAPATPATPAPPATPIADHSATQEIYPPPSTNVLSNSYGHTQLAYKIQAPQPTLSTIYAPASPAASIYENSKSGNTYSEALLDASYSVDDLTRLLQMENLNRNSATAYYQPAVYGPSYASHAEVPLYTIQPASPYHLPLPEPKYSSSAPSYAEANKSYSVVPPQYKTPAESNPATPGPSTASSSATQYTNYINKGYSSGPTQYGSAAEPNKDQQSAQSLTHQAVYSDPSGEYENSIPYNSLAYAYAPRPQPYGM